MVHAKCNKNWTVNEDLEKIEGGKHNFFHKVQISFENQRFSLLFDTIRICEYLNF